MSYRKLMTSLNNTTAENNDEEHIYLLWLPHVLIAFGFLTFLMINFWLYHRKHKERYQRKAEALETKQRMQERRRVLNIVRLRYLVKPETHSPPITSIPGCIPYANSESSDLSENQDEQGLIDTVTIWEEAKIG